MSQIIDLGKLRFHFAGAYDASTTYEVNDIVKYGGNVYAYTYALKTSNNLPTDNTYWALMIEGFKFEGVYATGTAYQIGDGVTHGGKVYICIQDTTGNTPPNATYWSQFADGIQWEGTYANATAYQKGDMVIYGGNTIYIAKVDTTGNLPSDATYWEQMLEGIGVESVYNAATAYARNDLVGYGGSVWRAKQNTTGNAPIAGANWEKFIGGIKATGAYNNATAYEIDEVVMYNNTLYRCIADSTGNIPTVTAYWELFIIGYYFAGDYAAGTTYQVNDIVKYGGQLYICTAVSTGNDPSNTSFWGTYTEGTSSKGAYDNTANYVLNDVVSYGGSLYKAKGNTVGNLPTVTANWDSFITGINPTGAWATATAYEPGDIVSYGGSSYRVLTTHGSSDFATDLAASRLELWSGGIRFRGTWSTATDYLKDDVATNGVSTYVCLVSHTSGTFNTDLTASKWQVFAQGGSNTIPSQTGNAGKALVTDGVNYDWEHAGESEWVTKTANYTAVDRDRLLLDSSGGAFTITLPASPALGAEIVLADSTGAIKDNVVTIARNGSVLAGASDDLDFDINNISFRLVYSDATNGWRIA